MPQIVKIALPLSIDRLFDYQAPPESKIKTGTRVIVDFRDQEQVGVVCSLSSETKIKKIKPIKKIIDANPPLKPLHFRLAKDLAKYYPYPTSEFIFAMLPAYLRKKNKFELETPEKSENENTLEQKPVFIKSNFFSDRYPIWKNEVKKALKSGSAVICLPQLDYLKRVKKNLQKDFSIPVTEFFSRQKIKNSYQEWIKSRKKSLILGTRSALFYFPQDTRLILIEEEANPYYFQELKPFYHLRDVALILSKITKSKLILAGSYPSLYTYLMIKNKKIKLIESESQKTEIKIIERDNFTKNKFISPILIELIRKLSSEKKRGVIIWNKKNFWRAVACTKCNATLQCQQCSGLLQQKDKNKNELLCPYCQKKTNAPSLCPECKSGYLKGKGVGIEKLKEILAKFFPQLNLQNFENNKSGGQILISTSKILKLLYEKRRFEVGFLLDIDSYLNQFNFDTTLDAFIYLKNLSLLFTDNFFIFSCRPQYYLFSYLNKDWYKFYNQELLLRKQMELPPFVKIIKVILRSKNEEKALKSSEKLYNILKEKNYKVFGPIKEHPYQLREKYRYSLTVKIRKKNLFEKKLYSEITRIKQKETQTAIIIK